MSEKQSNFSKSRVGAGHDFLSFRSTQAIKLEPGFGFSNYTYGPVIHRLSIEVCLVPVHEHLKILFAGRRTET